MNAFTDQPFSGNPAAVVLDGDALSDQQMQMIAPQLNNISETVYVCTATEPHADFYLRYFTATTEVELCGHATIAALYALAASGRLTGDNENRLIRVQTLAGALDLGVEFVAGQVVGASMTQPVARHGVPSVPDRVAAVLGLTPKAIREDLPIACVNTGIWSCYVPLLDLDALAAVAVDHTLIESLWPENPEFAGVYPFVITGGDSQAGRLRTQGRFFCPPKFGIAEDPVTGTASGALAAYLIRHGAMSVAGELEAHQGVEMGSPGHVHARQATSGAIEIRGQAVPIYRGELAL